METIPHTQLSCNGHTAPAVIPQGPAHLPEAALSLNGYVHVPGLPERVQVTVRSTSVDEPVHTVAQRFRHSMQAVVEAFAPPPTPSREERLSQLLACGTLKAVQKGDMSLVERLTKAFVLAAKGLVEPTDLPDTLAVRSQTSTDTWYTVNDAGACSCPDWGKHREEAHYRCKHIIASLFYRRTAQICEGRD